MENVKREVEREKRWKEEDRLRERRRTERGKVKTLVKRSMMSPL